MAIRGISWSFGIFWIAVPRKLWQPWSKVAQELDDRFQKSQDVFKSAFYSECEKKFLKPHKETFLNIIFENFCTL
jgi:hypothetical protein